MTSEKLISTIDLLYSIGTSMIQSEQKLNTAHDYNLDTIELARKILDTAMKYDRQAADGGGLEDDLYV